MSLRLRIETALRVPRVSRPRVEVGSGTATKDIETDSVRTVFGKLGIGEVAPPLVTVIPSTVANDTGA